MLTSKLISIVAGACGMMVIVYCIYFDRKRRSDPKFKSKLKERRKSAKKEVKEDRQEETKNSIPLTLDFHESFFLNEICTANQLLERGELEDGVKHLAIAYSVCGQQSQLLNFLEQTLHPLIFQLLVQQIPSET